MILVKEKNVIEPSFFQGKNLVMFGTFPSWFLNPTCYQLFNSSGQIKYDVLIDLMEGPDRKISGLRLLSWN